MNCPSCSSPLESNARFCGVCGYRLQANRASTPAPANTPPSGTPLGAPTGGAAAAKAPAATGQAQAQKASARPKAHSRAPKADELYIDKILNNRFKVESKIGEGGFGAVYRGIQLATNRKVALKLLHPEMTKDENLVARFRREGMVLCNLRDAHTITTYDFDQTPDGTLYIAMELLEGKSLHQIFHDQAPLEWKRVFKIMIEMCSSLAEAHAQGIVHRDLKPENIYLESRPGNPEFVKILDFGIAKVMKGDSIDPQSPQLTATGQTLGTLEYMSPEQLMGKQLDGRSDVYAIGVLAYEMITGRLPFPDAKGPAGLITAQLKQTPQPPSVANPKAMLTGQADRVILKCLEKDKNNRHADVTVLAAALQEVLDAAREQSNPLATPLPAAAVAAASQSRMPATPGADMLETRKGELPQVAPPPMPAPMPTPVPGPSPLGAGGHIATPGHGTPITNSGAPAYPSTQSNHGQAPMPSYPASQSQPANAPRLMVEARPTAPPANNSKLIYWIIGLLVLGAGAGAVAAYFMQ